MLVSYTTLFTDFSTFEDMIEAGYLIYFDNNEYSYTHKTEYCPDISFIDLHELCNEYRLLEGVV